MSESVTRHLKIVNEQGLHARAAAKLVEVAEGFDATAEVSQNGQSTGADSIMGLLMLAASKGTTIDVQVSGPDAEAMAAAVEALVADEFVAGLAEVAVAGTGWFCEGAGRGLRGINAGDEGGKMSDVGGAELRHAGGDRLIDKHWLLWSGNRPL